MVFGKKKEKKKKKLSSTSASQRAFYLHARANQPSARFSRVCALASTYSPQSGCITADSIMHRHGLQAEGLRCHNLLLQLLLGMELRSKTPEVRRSEPGTGACVVQPFGSFYGKKLELGWMNPAHLGCGWGSSIRSGSNDTYQMILFAFSERRGIKAADGWWLLYQSFSETARDHIHQWFHWSQTASEEKKSVAEGQHRIAFPGRLRAQRPDHVQASSDYISMFTFLCQTQVWSQSQRIKTGCVICGYFPVAGRASSA